MGVSIFDELLPILPASQIGDFATPGDFSITLGITQNLRIDNFFISTNDPADVVITITVQTSPNGPCPLRTITIPAGAGYATNSNAIDALDGLVVAQGGLVIPVGSQMILTIVNAMTSGTFLSYAAFGGVV